MDRLKTFCFLFLVSLHLACSSDSDDSPGTTCDTGETLCGTSCVDLASDPAHCGRCARSCESDEICRDGTCVELQCEAGLEACAGECVDTSTATEHCGACGEACAPGESCVDGSCLGCEPGESACPSGCADTQRDVDNCGTCGTQCAAQEICQAGACTCAEGLRRCDELCTDLSSDDANCGSCGTSCRNGQVCRDGRCECPEGLEECEGACVDLQADPLHCGSCGQSCEGRFASSEGVCEAGACTLHCLPGRAVCDGDWREGCLVHLETDLAHCGACHNDCLRANVEEAVCSDGECSIAKCKDGYESCDPSTYGCETDVRSNILHCGACNVSCGDLPNNAATPACNDGVCALICESGWHDCDGSVLTGCEVSDAHFLVANDHCGGCNIRCEDTYSCVEGVCVPEREWPQWPLPPEDMSSYEIDAKAGTVLDPITGLMWQREHRTEPIDWDDIFDYCKELSLGGFDDWRVPTIMELLTIVKASASKPAVHTPAFPGIEEGADFWSANTFAGTLLGSTPHDLKRTVNFWLGGVGFVNKEDQALVRCVRAGKGKAGPRFEVQDDPNVIFEPRTGLYWQRDTAGTFWPMSQAAAHCASLTLGGKTDWRVPTRMELESLTDFSREKPALDPLFLAGGELFWTSTPDLEFATHWLVDHQGGQSYNSLGAIPSLPIYVRCVRSDPAP